MLIVTENFSILRFRIPTGESWLQSRKYEKTSAPSQKSWAQSTVKWWNSFRVPKRHWKWSALCPRWQNISKASLNKMNWTRKVFSWWVWDRMKKPKVTQKVRSIKNRLKDSMSITANLQPLVWVSSTGKMKRSALKMNNWEDSLQRPWLIPN